jgi:membrane associated rhomboid family serine protease
VIILILYGGIFYGALPHGNTIISWEGHLSGAIAGWFIAKKQHG